MPRASSDKNLEHQVAQLVQNQHLPDSWSEGAKHAYEAMQSDYPPGEGRRIFFEKALELGKGGNLKEIVNSVYKKGATLPSRRRADVSIKLNRDRPVPPTVTILRRGS